MFPVFMSHTPAGISTNQLMHYSQVAHFNRFAKFDWANSQLNYVKYRSIKPPVYNLNNVKANVTLHYSDNDWLAAVKDVKRLYAQLPNAIVNHIPDPKFDHMDFVWGSNTRKMLYKDIIASMLSYDQNMDKDKWIVFKRKKRYISFFIAAFIYLKKIKRKMKLEDKVANIQLFFAHFKYNFFPSLPNTQKY